LNYLQKVPWDKAFRRCSIPVQSELPLKTIFFPEFVEGLCMKVFWLSANLVLVRNWTRCIYFTVSLPVIIFQIQGMLKEIEKLDLHSLFGNKMACASCHSKIVIANFVISQHLYIPHATCSRLFIPAYNSLCW